MSVALKVSSDLSTIVRLCECTLQKYCLEIAGRDSAIGSSAGDLDLRQSQEVLSP